MKQDMDDSCNADLHAYVREELLTDARRAPRKIPAGISGTEEYVHVEHRERYDFRRGVSFKERCEWKLTRKLGIDAIDRGRVPFDVTLALRAPEMSEEDAMIAMIDASEDHEEDEYDFVCDLAAPDIEGVECDEVAHDATDTDIDQVTVRRTIGKKEVAAASYFMTRVVPMLPRPKRWWGRRREQYPESHLPKRPKYHAKAA